MDTHYDEGAATDYGWKQEQEKKAFLADLGRLPLTRVAQEVDSVTFLTPAERDTLKRAAADWLAKRAADVRERVRREADAMDDKLSDVVVQTDTMKFDVETLIAQGKTGQLTFAEFEKRFSDLERELGSLRRRTSDVTRNVDSLRTRDEDPEAYRQELEKKYPLIKDGVFGRVFYKVEPL